MDFTKVFKNKLNMRKYTYLLFFILGLQELTQAQVLDPFKKGDRVVFAGNSITEAGYYESYIRLYYMTHFPDRALKVFNGGVGGDVAGQIYARLDSDILKKKPTVLVVTFGMNDSKYFEYQKTTDHEKVTRDAVDESYKSFIMIADKLKNVSGLRPVIMTTSPYDETMKNDNNYFPGKSHTIEEIARFQKEVAEKNHWPFVDILHPMTEINLREQKKEPSFTLTGSDRIHPGNAGHMVMAYFFLKDQGLAGAPVAEVKISASGRKTERSVNCSVSGLIISPQSVKFSYLAKSLPYPIDTVTRIWQNPQKQSDALKIIPFTSEFNREVLAVSGLKPGLYSLKIDGKEAGRWTAPQFAEGINLALVKSTPQYRQALEIMNLNQQIHDIEAKFRNYYWMAFDFLKDKGMLYNDSDAARDTVNKYAPTNGWVNAKKEDYEQVRVKSSREALENQTDSLFDRIYTINKPVKRRIEIELIK